ncbi:hypothetical protein OV079_15200 [Nannocystis pusilla]|uniref:Uncharacterized protein n=1 Tax=Nannocystis pusilla TaxID=889268 RepID=A0A9X3EUK3_9BACT|nr:hypothetical protein [Nannocystis pusilla]MCY1006876.1 hypothetical protein [Nannocystis pusilla]
MAAALAATGGVGDPPVLATTRSGTWPQGHVPEGIELRPLDVAALAPADIAAVLAGVQSLVVCYAPGKQQDRRELYVEGTRRLLAAAVTLPLTRLVYTSSTSALPDRDAWLDDDCREWPDEPRGRVQREAEGWCETPARATQCHGRSSASAASTVRVASCSASTAAPATTQSSRATACSRPTSSIARTQCRPSSPP